MIAKTFWVPGRKMENFYLNFSPFTVKRKILSVWVFFTSLPTTYLCVFAQVNESKPFWQNRAMWLMLLWVNRKISLCEVLILHFDMTMSPSFSLCPYSAAEWSQALLYRIEKEPLHQQEHEGHLPRFHREAGLY